MPDTTYGLDESPYCSQGRVDISFILLGVGCGVSSNIKKLETAACEADFPRQHLPPMILANGATIFICIIYIKFRVNLESCAASLQ